MQDKECLLQERDDLLKRLSMVDDIFSENERRFGAVLHLLMHELAVPEATLADLSDADNNVFDEALNEVSVSNPH